MIWYKNLKSIKKKRMNAEFWKKINKKRIGLYLLSGSSPTLFFYLFFLSWHGVVGRWVETTSNSQPLYLNVRDMARSPWPYNKKKYLKIRDWFLKYFLFKNILD
jgi:hypothetical protein